MENKRYYDGTKLLSLLDINGEKPELYMSTTNRSAGKTTYFSRWLINRFLKYNEKFILLYRFQNELVDISDRFFKDIGALFFPSHEMTDKPKQRGVYCELFLDEKPCGYAISINSADSVKKLSHLFSDAERIFFDEFQSENNHYCPNELSKFISIHISIARGKGKQTRYLPVYMASNSVSILNPYFAGLGITERLNNAKYLRGDGWVLEQGFYNDVASMQKESAFNRAFSANRQVQYASQNIYLNDSETFIEKMCGNSRYLCTIKYDGYNFGVRSFSEQGIVYISNSADLDFYVRFSTGVSDHDTNYVLLQENKMVVDLLRYYFNTGAMRFQNQKAKQAIIKTLKY